MTAGTSVLRHVQTYRLFAEPIELTLSNAAPLRIIANYEALGLHKFIERLLNHVSGTISEVACHRFWPSIGRPPYFARRQVLDSWL
jgi:hypothetical protein